MGLLSPCVITAHLSGKLSKSKGLTKNFQSLPPTHTLYSSSDVGLTDFQTTTNKETSDKTTTKVCLVKFEFQINNN